jgi:hypothetical protein
LSRVQGSQWWGGMGWLKPRNVAAVPVAAFLLQQPSGQAGCYTAS